MNDADKHDQSADDDGGAVGALGEAIRHLIPDRDADVADGKDLPDDASGVEVPQDGDPGR